MTYPGDAGTRFDRHYYTRQPPADGDGVLGSVRTGELCRFRDEAAMRAALALPDTPRVMADVAGFTDAKPVQSLAGPV